MFCTMMKDLDEPVEERVEHSRVARASLHDGKRAGEAPIAPARPRRQSLTAVANPARRAQYSHARFWDRARKFICSASRTSPSLR